MRYELGRTIDTDGRQPVGVPTGRQPYHAWRLDVAREFVGNMRDTPISGAVFRDASGAYLYPLQGIVDDHRAHGRVVVLCPFGWDGSASTQFSGPSPSRTPFWYAYLSTLRLLAARFAGQSDVWIEVWNEPYRFDRADGVTDADWLRDMTTLVRTVREAGNTSIIVVPVAEQGQDERVLLTQGAALAAIAPNVLFDVHAYEKWLLVDASAMGTRWQQLRAAGLPVLIGEVAPLNAGTLMNPRAFLDSAYANGFSISA